MSEKVILILVDGMRPDGMMACGHSYPQKFISEASYSLSARTVMPSVTLPCHMSLFHSVDPDRHGILSNTYVPQVRPVVGLFDRLDMYGKKCAFYYTWEELRDLCRPDHLHMTMCINQHKQTDTDIKITDEAIKYINAEEPDFLFLYLGETDEVGGHSCGWMSEQYMASVAKAWGCIEKLVSEISDEYTVIVCADHGGHDRSHGSDCPEDMTIPVAIRGPRFEKGRELENVSIKDIATTVADLLEVPAVKEWEGKVLR
ncbi:MAG: alkaline phosphatase family protein [Clostridia bacterium]|nr:alkaline phosphatase family protein [Clostridia bacterium]